jgi:hypothetical protein
MANLAAPPPPAAVFTVQVTLPPLLRVDEKENGSTIQHIAAPPWSGDGTVEALEHNRMRRFTVTLSFAVLQAELQGFLNTAGDDNGTS